MKTQLVENLPLRVRIQCSKGGLEKITLEPASSLTLIFEGDLSKQKVVDEWFEAFFSGEHRSFPLPFVNSLKPFTWKVLCALQNIPFGKTLSYLDVAANVGNAKAARAVGNACRVNPFPLVLPCHRVLHSSGGLGGFAYGLEMKKELLHFEETVTRH